MHRGAVADNGEVSKLGALALARADDKLKGLMAESRFKPDEKQFLLDKWKQLRSSRILREFPDVLSD